MDGTNLELIGQLAETLQRVAGNEDFDANGVRTVLHRGRMCELLSWEDKDGNIVKQELTFAGSVIEHRTRARVRTGHVPMSEEQSGSGQAAKSIDLDPNPSQKTLAHAAHFLKRSPMRDFYTQHLLKQVNEALNIGFGDERTCVENPQSFGRGKSRLTLGIGGPRKGARRKQKISPANKGKAKSSDDPVGTLTAIAVIVALIIATLVLMA